MEAKEQVAITVGGRRVMVPEQTTTAEIRTLAGLDRGHVLARTSGGMNKVVSGRLAVKEGEAFVVGRSFTKGSMDDVRLAGELERLAPFFQIEVDDWLSWVIIHDFGLPEGYNRSGYTSPQNGDFRRLMGAAPIQGVCRHSVYTTDHWRESADRSAP